MVYIKIKNEEKILWPYYLLIVVLSLYVVFYFFDVSDIIKYSPTEEYSSFYPTPVYTASPTEENFESPIAASSAIIDSSPNGDSRIIPSQEYGPSPSLKPSLIDSIPSPTLSPAASLTTSPSVEASPGVSVVESPSPSVTPNLEVASLVFCVPDWSCSEWGGCKDGISRRSCDDKNDCHNILDKPGEALYCSVSVRGKIGEIEGEDDDEQAGSGGIIERSSICIPRIICEAFEECSYSDEVDDVLIGNVRLYGLRKRICKDLNKCINDYGESIPCQSYVEISSDKEVVCDRDMITLYKDGSNVGYIETDNLKMNRLNSIFVQNRLEECNFCYNGIKDDNEEGVDCGENCKKCETDVLDFIFLKFGLFIVTGFISVLLVFRILNSNYYKS